MYIVTDDKIYTESLFSESMDWYTLRYNRLSNKIGPLAKSIFMDNAIVCSNIKGFNGWDFLLIQKYSQTSQFDTINEFLSKNDFKYNILAIAGSGQKFHGFRKRSWISELGNLHLTAYLDCQLPAENSSAQMMVLSSVSSVEAIKSVAKDKISPKIKWMNDIIINNSKVGGVITQGRLQGNLVQNILLGIGINVNSVPKVQRGEVVPTVTSIGAEVRDGSVELVEFLSSLSEKLIKNLDILKNNGFNILYKKYIEYSYLIGKKIKIISDPIKGESEKLYEGIIESISDKLEIKLFKQNELVTKGRIVSLEI